MLAAAGFAFVLFVFVSGVVVLTLTLWGARRRQKAEAQRPPLSRREQLPPKASGAVLRQVADAEIEREIREGRVINAIRLYQEKTGAGQDEARSAVEAWRERLHAS